MPNRQVLTEASEISHEHSVSIQQFLQILADYNTAIWPMQFVLLGVAGVALYISAVPSDGGAIIPPLLLAAMWGWSGSVYHLIFFRRIDPAAVVAVPLISSAIGTSAALSLAIAEDLGLGIASLVALTVLLRARVSHKLQSAV